LVRLSVVLLTALSIHPARAAVPLVSPADGSDTVLALRSQPEGQFQVQYQRESAGNSAETISVGIGRDFHYIDDPKFLKVYDYRLRRILVVSPDHRTLVNDSLYAEVWYRAMELQNRVVLSGALKGAGIADPKIAQVNDPFWMETALGVTSPRLSRPELQKVEDETRTRWLLKGDEVATVRYGSEPVPESVRGGLRRFWGTIVQVHPSIADDLATSGRMPEELWVKGITVGKPPTVTHWRLISRRWEPAAYPLPAHLVPAPTTSTRAFPDVFAILAKLVAEKKVPPQPTVYVSRAEGAIQRGAGLEAMVWIIEMSLAEGRQEAPCGENETRPFCTLSVNAGPLAKTDPRTAIAFAKRAPDAEDRLQFDNLPNAYLLRLLWATKPPGKGVAPEDSERNLLAALRASPVANFCKDTGDFYAQAWQPFAAWQVWDLGRLMAGHTAGDLLDQIDVLEDKLATNESKFF
jgi:hypothetical protein